MLRVPLLAFSALLAAFSCGPGIQKYLGRATLSVDDGTAYDFGNRLFGTNNDVTFLVTNYGGTTATSIAIGSPALAAPFSFVGGVFPGTGGNCKTTLSSTASCSLVIRFTPSAYTTATDTLRLTYNDGTTSKSVSRQIQGTGVDLASLSISNGPTYDYGTIAVFTPTDATFTITNSGTSTATAMTAGTPPLAAPFVFKGGSYPGIGGSCAPSLGAAGTCTVVVTFTPTSATLSADTLRISYNDGTATQTVARPIQGTGL